MGLQGFEKRLERLVEGAFARAFRSELRPVEVGRRIARSMDQGLTIGVRGETIAPNHFEVFLSEQDFENLAGPGDGFAAELAGAVDEHGRDEGYQLKGPPEVELVADPSTRPGQFRVSATIRAGTRVLRSAGWLLLSDGRRVPVTEQPLVLGRLPECDVPLSDTNVSRRHAEVRIVDGLPVIIDLGSTNGTRVNGRNLAPNGYGVVLSDGDEISIGAAVLRYDAVKRG